MKFEEFINNRIYHDQKYSDDILVFDVQEDRVFSKSLVTGYMRVIYKRNFDEKRFEFNDHEE